MKVVLIQLLFTSVVLCSPRLDPLVNTNIGLIRGLPAPDGDYAMFLGIPYARVNESNPFGVSQPYPAFEEEFDFNRDLAEGFHLTEDGELEEIIRQFYIGDETPSIELKQELINFESDYRFNYPAQQSVQKYLAFGGIVYRYVFSYSGSRNFVKTAYNVTGEGAAHADDLSYLFDMPLIVSEEPTENDQITIDRMTTMWTNFAKYGDPTPGTSDLLPVKWTPVTEDRMTYLDIDSDLTLKTSPFHDRITFWTLFYRMYKNAIKGYNGPRVDKL